MVRQARHDDIAAMHRIRMSVRENRLTSLALTEADYAAVLESGRGWVAECDGVVVGFAICNAASGNIWALFVDPSHERRGYGRQLHDAMMTWLRPRCARVWLTTEPGTRAERFYECAGWKRAGTTSSGEVRFERDV